MALTCITRACILTTLSIYVFAGHDIFQKRKQLRSLSVASSAEFALENPFVSYKTTEIQVTSELANIGGAAPDDSSQRLLGLTPRSRVTSNQGYEQYSITIERGATQMLPTPRAQSFHTAKNSVALEANAAAWGYTKCALLFFVSLLITWVRDFCFRSLYDCTLFSVHLGPFIHLHMPSVLVLFGAQLALHYSFQSDAVWL